MARKGIDLSSHNTPKDNPTSIDWNKVKKHGVEFVVIRAITKYFTADRMFESYYKKANEVGIPVIGVYQYSYAYTANNAIKEANALLKVLNGRKTFVWLDIEDNSIAGKGLNLINAILAYKKIIEDSGNRFGVYSGYSFYNTNLKPYSSYLSDIPLWIAKYGSNPKIDFSVPYPSIKLNIPNLYAMQYSSKGKVNGINTDVDIDVAYDNYTLTDNSKKVTVNPTSTGIKQGTVTANSLYIRSDYSANSDIIGLLKKDSTVSYDMTKNGFVRIAGWISEKYLGINGNLGTVTANSLYVRNISNSTTSNKLGYLKKESKIKIYTKENGFCYFEGYISKKYLK
jgi:GH25 family lysozyme M1 (1,4-beta-N-acetylmuramidase)